jgi:hypothetical protein
LPKMKCPSLTRIFCWLAVPAVLLSLCPLPDALAQDQTPPPQSTSRGENFSAKPPAQLFATDCTGAGCHKGPQGLGKGQFPGALAGFLREHYTNSRESAAALAGYLSKIPSGPEPREVRTPRSGRPAASAAAPAWGDGGESKPTPPNEVRGSRQQPAGRTSRAAVRPDDEPSATPSAPPVAAPPAAEPNPSARGQRGRQPVTAAAPPPPPPPPEPEVPAAPPPPPPPAPKQFDIFD